MKHKPVNLGKLLEAHSLKQQARAAKDPVVDAIEGAIELIRDIQNISPELREMSSKQLEALETALKGLRS